VRTDPVPSTGSRAGAPAWLRITIPAVLILAWFALFGAGGISFASISQVSTNDQVQFLPANAEATEVNELQADFRDGEAIPSIVVFESGTGLDEVALDELASVRERLGEIEGVVIDQASPVIASDDGLAAELIVPIDAEADLDETIAQLRAVLTEETPEGVEAFVTGPAGFTADLVEGFAGIDGLLLGVALAAVFVILVLVYRSPLLPVIVLVTSLTALCASVFVVVGLARADIILLSGQTQGILFILVIGAATDYALLYTARYREALQRHRSKWDATWRALEGSWEPILASGGTVIAGLLILLFSELNSNKALGPIAAIGIACSLLAALSLLPALLLLAGRAAFWPLRPHPTAHAASDLVTRGRGFWPRAARSVAARARVLWIASTLVLAAMSLGVLQLHADGVPSSEYVLGQSQAREGQAVLGEHFPAGSGTPVLVVSPESELQSAADALLGESAVSSVSVVTADSPSGSAAIAENGVQPLGPPGTPSPEPTVVEGRVLLQATLDVAADSEEAERTVRELRNELSDVDEAILVGGQSAIALDTNDAAIADRTLIIPLVLAAILIILMLLLRAILAPVLLIASVVLSFGAALGVAALVFDGIFDFPGADASVPLFAFVFLVALGVDYNIFLMTRVREESIAHGTREGVLRGLTLTGGVITSAGIVLAATFAALGVIPILFLAQIAFIVAFGVLLDTFLVRTLLVPALSYDIGRAVWWPSRLSRASERVLR
jgi:putative drug exporter of the RND superfamily